MTQIGTHQLCAQRSVPHPQAVVSLAQLLRSCHLLPLLTRAQAVKCIGFSESVITLGGEGVSSAFLLDTDVRLRPDSALLHKQERNSCQWQIPCCPIMWLSPFALHQLTQRPPPSLSTQLLTHKLTCACAAVRLMRAYSCACALTATAATARDT